MYTYINNTQTHIVIFISRFQDETGYKEIILPPCSTKINT